jgi:hypothetical protein
VRFTLAGSKTGPDGQGQSGARFVSDSGRVILETNDWNTAYAFQLGGIQPIPASFEVKWKVEGYFQDEFAPAAERGPALENIVTVAAGLPDGSHTLELAGPAPVLLAAIRVYSPSKFPRASAP